MRDQTVIEMRSPTRSACRTTALAAVIRGVQLLDKAPDGSHRPGGTASGQFHGRWITAFTDAIPPGRFGHGDECKDLRQTDEARLRQTRKVVQVEGRVRGLGMGGMGALGARLAGFHVHSLLLRKWTQDREPEGAILGGTLKGEGQRLIQYFVFIGFYKAPLFFPPFGKSRRRLATRSDCVLEN